MTEERISFVLRDDATATSEPVSFGVFIPGQWVKRKPLTPDDLGLTLSDVRERIREYDLPIDEKHPHEERKHRARAAEKRTSDPQGPADAPPLGEPKTEENA